MDCYVEVVRGRVVESLHTVSVGVSHGPVGGGGRDCEAVPGPLDAGRLLPVTFGRSAVKPLQALPLVTSGAAERFGLDDTELAVAAGSHLGDQVHVNAVQSMLRKAGLSPRMLRCGVQRPLGQKAADMLVRRNEPPCPLHNNCSGKHAGLLILGRHLQIDIDEYTNADHPIQQLVIKTLLELAGVNLNAAVVGIDGCGIPTLALPIGAWAMAYNRFGNGTAQNPDLALASTRLRVAIAKHPVMLAGIDQFDTRVIQLLGENGLVKSGAEGVVGGFIGFGCNRMGFFVKAIDGSLRAARAVTAALLQHVQPSSDRSVEYLSLVAGESVIDCRGRPVGELRVSLANRLTDLPPCPPKRPPFANRPDLPKWRADLRK